MAERAWVEIPRSRWELFCMGGAGPALFLLGAILNRWESPVAVLTMFAAVLLMFFSVFWFVRARTKMVQYEDTGDGFTIIKGRKTRSFSDAQIVGLGWQSFARWRYTSLRLLQLWIDGDAKPLELRNAIYYGDVDPLAELINRLMAAQQEKAQQTLSDGGNVRGDGWAISSTCLTVVSGKQDIEIPLEDLARPYVIDGKLKLWRKSCDNAVLEFSLPAQNGNLLIALLNQLLAATCNESVPAGDAGLGPILFERKTGPVAKGVLWLLVVALVGLAVNCLLRADLRLFGACFLFIGAGALITALHCQTTVVCFHRRGFKKNGLFGHAHLHETDIDAVTIHILPTSDWGFELGTLVLAKLEPLTGKGLNQLTYVAYIFKGDPSFAWVLDQLTQVFVNRFAAEIKAGKTVV